MATPDPLDDVNDALTRLEKTVADLLGPADPIPADRHYDARTAALNLMRSIHDADPGVWVPLAELGNYRHDRVRYRDLQVHLAWLVEAGQLQRITVSQPGNNGRFALLRLTTDVDDVDTAPIAARINAQLAPLGHRLEVHQARPTLLHFHHRVVTVAGGTTYQCYRRWHRWEPHLERIEPPQEAP